VIPLGDQLAWRLRSCRQPPVSYELESSSKGRSRPVQGPLAHSARRVDHSPMNKPPPETPPLHRERPVVGSIFGTTSLGRRGGTSEHNLSSGFLEVPADGQYTFTPAPPARPPCCGCMRPPSSIRLHTRARRDVGHVRLDARAGHPFRLYWQCSAKAPRLDISGP